MKKILRISLALIMLTSLSACMVVPARDRPYYREAYRHEPHHYPKHNEGWRRRW